MKKYYVFLFLFCCLALPAQTRHHHIEASLGALVDSRLFDISAVYPENPAFATASLGYCYSFNRWFSLGAWIGVPYNAPVPVIGGIKCVFGDIDKLAFTKKRRARIGCSS